MKPLRNRKLSKELEDYKEMEKIGEGGCGVVYKAIHRNTNQIVAVKKITFLRKDDGMDSSIVREISILKELQHTNIVRLLDVVHGDDCTYLVLEFLDSDLEQHMHTCPQFANGHHHQLVKRYLYQLLQGVAYIHSRRVIHRDLKPGNLLIDKRTNSLKIADFGFARTFAIPVRSFTTWGMTLQYRAPEILLGALQYSIPSDLWSVGCVFAEMVNQRPLFLGISEIDQLFKIFSIIGSPNEDCWPGVTSLPDFKSTLPKWPPKDLTEVVPNLDAAGHDLLSKLLQLDPRKRITAGQALEHEYFNDVDVGSDL